MTKADSVHSTRGPTAPKTGKVRAPLPTTNRPEDPAFRAIATHRQAAKAHTKAVETQFASDGKVTKDFYARLETTTSKACDDMFSAARVLVKTKPTTPPGAIAMLKYLATVFDDEGSGVDCSSMPDDIDGEAWPAFVFRTIAHAGAAMSNIVEFPESDRPMTESEIAELHGRAFRDLEPLICDCVSMAKMPLRRQGPTMRAITASWFLRSVTPPKCWKLSRTDYYAAWHGENRLAP